MVRQVRSWHHWAFTCAQHSTAQDFPAASSDLQEEEEDDDYGLYGRPRDARQRCVDRDLRAAACGSTRSSWQPKAPLHWTAHPRPLLKSAVEGEQEHIPRRGKTARRSCSIRLRGLLKVKADDINEATVAYSPFRPASPIAGSSATRAEFNMGGLSGPAFQARHGSSRGVTYGSRSSNAGAVSTPTVTCAGCGASGRGPSLC
ncbi:uncharacterized protein LOC142774868 [Rhipicephalus microplus]|uniref:uncharacterized protein LOC142774868 n=1 Tax=Rhipicephalus microplus TaxID=6941 RepID=UPI003F6AE3B4